MDELKNQALNVLSPMKLTHRGMYIECAMDTHRILPFRINFVSLCSDYSYCV